MLRQPRASAKEEIARFLQHGLAPITDDEAALVELGFARAHPNASGGFEGSLWERSLDRGYRQTASGLRRVLIRQRAFLVTKRTRHHPK
jgi:hypothetical protein